MIDRPPTPLETLRRAREIGREEGLHYIYIGNVPEEGGQDTICPGCSHVLIRRDGFGEITTHMQGDHCPDCGAPVGRDRIRLWRRRPEVRPDLRFRLRQDGERGLDSGNHSTRDPAFRFVPLSQAEFATFNFAFESETRIRFETDAAGKITDLRVPARNGELTARWVR